MTFEELLKACSTGSMPWVSDIEGLLGRVAVIKDNGRHKGIGVQFVGYKNEDWFWDSEATDARTKYMRNLRLLDPDYCYDPSHKEVAANLDNPGKAPECMTCHKKVSL